MALAGLLLLALLTVAPLISARAIINEEDINQQETTLCPPSIHCCRYPPQSQEFLSCCNASGCCSSCDDLNIYEGHGKFDTREDCVDAYDCCVSTFLSDEYKKCCFGRGCCPFCGSVPEGCLYKDELYSWGSVVEISPDNCTKLVCGANLSNSSPYVTGVIVHLDNLPRIDGADCEGKESESCVDSRGIVRHTGSKWLASPCSSCKCEGGHVKCDSVELVCDPAPHPSCKEVPGDCCPSWNCQDLPSSTVASAEGRKSVPYGQIGCIDSQGVHHPVGATWVDPRNPCVHYLCTHEGTEKLPGRYCTPLGPRPYAGCKLAREDCCDVWNCTGCLDDSGVYRKVGEEWYDPLDACFHLECTDSGIRRNRKLCPALEPPSPECEVIVENCCPRLQCPGCVDERGEYRQLGEEWEDATEPCTRYKCLDVGIEKTEVYCPPLGPRPHLGCRTVTEDCCQKWLCSGCVDEEGGRRQHGDIWVHPHQPCLRHLCTRFGIQTSDVDCPPLPPRPHSGCTAVKDGCCRTWSCSGCVDEQGVHRDVGESWVDPTDPCRIYICTLDGIERQPRRLCEPVAPQPHIGCRLVVENCCQVWECSGCVDEQGLHRKVGEEWYDSLNLCIHNECTDNGIERSRRKCPGLFPQPHPECELVVDNCCQTWQCPGCVDSNGVYRELGEEWSDSVDFCTHYKCLQVGIEKTEIYCPPIEPPPHASCQLVTRNCCKVWKCTGCIDEVGVHHEVGDWWLDQEDHCVHSHCTKDGIKKSAVDCPPLAPQPHAACQLLRDDCCHVWICQRCIDAQGNERELAEEWTDPVDPCKHHVCTKSGIETAVIDCLPPPPPPRSDCELRVRPGECCYTWICYPVNRPCQSTVPCQLLGGQCREHCDGRGVPVPGACVDNCVCCVPELEACLTSTRACGNILGRCDLECRSDEDPVRHLCATDSCFCCVPRSRPCQATSLCGLFNGQCLGECRRGEIAVAGVCATDKCVCCLPEPRRPCQESRSCRALNGRCKRGCSGDEKAFQGMCETEDCVCCVPDPDECQRETRACGNIGGRCDLECRSDEDPVRHLCATDSCLCCVPKPTTCSRKSPECLHKGGRCAQTCFADEDSLGYLCEKDCFCCIPRKAVYAAIS